MANNTRGCPILRLIEKKNTSIILGSSIILCNILITYDQGTPCSKLERDNYLGKTIRL